MAYQRKQIGSPCARCGEAVHDESVAVRTLSKILPYTPKIWHRRCFEERGTEQRCAPQQRPAFQT